MSRRRSAGACGRVHVFAAATLERATLAAAACALAAGGIAALAAVPAHAGATAVARVASVHIDDVVAEPAGEEVIVSFRAQTRNREPVRGLDADDVRVRDNGRAIPTERLALLPLAKAGTGGSIVFVLDASAKMRGESFAWARAAVERVTDQLEPGDRVSVVTFAERVDVVVPAGTPPDDALAALEGLEADGEADAAQLFEGVFKAVDSLRAGRDLPRRSVVIVFSDGGDHGSRATLAEIVDRARGREGQPRIPVFTIGFDPTGSGNLGALAELARETGAEPFVAQSSDLLPEYFDRIRRRMLESLVVRYPAELDGERHSIEVTVGRHADTATVAYPDAGTSLFQLLFGAVALALAILVAAFVHRTTRHAGRLLFLDGPRKGETVSIQGTLLSVGALPDNDIVIPSPAVSRFHAQLRRRGKKVLVQDIGSANGTYVNGTAVKQCALEPGDLLRIGDVELAYQR